MFSARREGSMPPRGVGEVVGMDMGVGVGRHANGGAKSPENWLTVAGGESE